MKLVTFTNGTADFVGVVEMDHVVNLNQVLELPDLTMEEVINRGKDFLKIVSSAVQKALNDQVHRHPVKNVSFKAPISQPGKVVCVGNNYMDHCREQNIEPPKKPLIFSKWSSCIIGPDDVIVLPEASEQVDFEAELAVVIGKEGKNIPKEKVWDYIYGYLIVNDISARDVQFSDGQWVRGKSYDTFLPAGPYLVTADAVPDPQNLDIILSINGETYQDSNTREMIFDIPELISYLSRGFTFQPGDLLATGTPNGVGVFRNPPIFLKDGDEVSITIEGLGTLTNTCRQQTILKEVLGGHGNEIKR